jgi:hypothetical protein
MESHSSSSDWLGGGFTEREDFLGGKEIITESEPIMGSVRDEYFK